MQKLNGNTLVFLVTALSMGGCKLASSDSGTKSIDFGKVQNAPTSGNQFSTEGQFQLTVQQPTNPNPLGMAVIDYLVVLDPNRPVIKTTKVTPDAQLSQSGASISLDPEEVLVPSGNEVKCSLSEGACASYKSGHFLIEVSKTSRKIDIITYSGVTAPFLKNLGSRPLSDSISGNIPTGNLPAQSNGSSNATSNPGNNGSSGSFCVTRSTTGGA